MPRALSFSLQLQRVYLLTRIIYWFELLISSKKENFSSSVVVSHLSKVKMAECRVCCRPSKPQKPNCGHYGVMSCMSCKVFFKRCHEEYFKGGDFSKYPCIHEDGSCQINYEQPIKCKYCRFLKCSLLGMDPTRILGEEARKKFCSKKNRVVPGPLDLELDVLSFQRYLKELENLGTYYLGAELNIGE